MCKVWDSHKDLSLVSKLVDKFAKWFANLVKDDMKIELRSLIVAHLKNK